MNHTLSRIISYKKEAILRAKQLMGEASLLTQIRTLSPTKGFASILKSKVEAREVALISEIKKTAPGKGLIRRSFNPIRIAKTYEQAGSSAISVVTEETLYHGRSSFLKEIRSNTDLALLRKDVIFDPYQVIESRALGADAILLMACALSIKQAQELENVALSLGMDVVIEVHDQMQLDMAFALNSKLICINNRNPRTLEVDLDNTRNLVPLIDNSYTVVCEGGIQSIEDIRELNRYHVYSFLVGEYILSKPNIKNAIQVLLKE